jgi:hypothetical protein
MAVSGIVTDVRLRHPPNASPAMLTTESGIVTNVNPVA